MQSRTFKTLLVGSIVLAAGSAAQAQMTQGVAGSGLYVGGSLGKPYYDDAVNGVQGDEKGVAAKAFVGYGFLPWLAVEAGGMTLGRVVNGRAAATQVKLYGGYADLVGTVPVGGQFSVLGRVGYARVKANSAVGADDTGNALKFGLGAQYNLARNIAVRAEWERYRVDVFNTKPNADQYTLGVTYTF